MRFLSTLAASILGTLVALIIMGLVGFMFLTALMATTTAPSSNVRAGSVLEIRMAGTVPEMASSDPFEQMMSISPPFDLVGLKSGLERAANDERIEAVWLRTQGVAAPWGTLQEIRQALLAFKESGKPLIASSGQSFVTERDYFLSSVADEVYAAPGALFEFNGLYAQTFFYKGLLDRLNIEPTIVRAGSFKSAVEPFTRTDMSEESRTQLSALLSTHTNVLVEAIAASRDTARAYVESLMQDEAFITTDDAHSAGLVDALLFDDAVKGIISERIGTASGDDLQTIRLRSYVRAPGSAGGAIAGTIGVVYAVGVITGGESATGGGNVGSATFVRAMEQIRENDRVKAVVLRINSPGGSATASDAMWQAIDRTAQAKPVIVSMGDVAASGGYWIATAGDTIVADATTITGSIGVFGMHFSIGDMLDSKLGISSDQVTTSAYADMFSGMRPLRPAEEVMLGRAIDKTYTDFLELVAGSRGMEVDAVHEIAQGRVWTGEDALSLGLVDLMGGMDTAVRLAAERAGLEEGTYRLLRLPRPKTLMQELEEALLARVGRVFGAPAMGDQLRAHTRMIEEVIQMQGVPQARMPLDLTIR